MYTGTWGSERIAKNEKREGEGKKAIHIP